VDTNSLLLVAIGLSMDAFAVAIGRGTVISRGNRVRGALAMALAFGAFQALMPLAGWYVGSGVARIFGEIGHWIAFLLLAGIGGRMVHDSFSADRGSTEPVLSARLLLLLALATSIDALVAGVGLRLADPATSIVRAALMIGFVTFALSLAGGLAGSRLGERFGRSMEALGGIVLVAIGLRILVSNLNG